MNQCKVVFVLFLCFLTVSCDYTHLNERDFGLNSSDTSVCAEGQAEASSPVDFFTVQERVFKQSCFNCHGNGSSAAGVNLDTYAQAFRAADRISNSVESGRMPLGGSLSQEQIDLVVDWVRLGAIEGSPQNQQNCDTEITQNENSNTDLPDTNQPNNDPQSPPDDEPDNSPLVTVPSDSEITFSLVRNKIFQIRCFACHSDAGGNADGLNLETYFGALEELEDIEERVLDNEMPPRQPLNLIEKETLIRWIDLGAPQ